MNQTLIFRPVVVLPTDTNAGTLADVLRRVRGQGLPMIVVDDGSTDDTPEILKDLQDPGRF
jgi:glycosyltransferase involved in cell wall biosynthesis